MATILVIDDEPFILNNLTMLLEFEHFNVLTCTEGKDALEILAEEPVNLILCDMLMYPMNGFEILQAVRQDPNTADIPFVFVTGMRWTASEARDQGVSAFLIKPYTRMELLGMVERQLVGNATRHGN
ncbi:MAG: response regulator [Chloroflexota bacterium]